MEVYSIKINKLTDFVSVCCVNTNSNHHRGCEVPLVYQRSTSMFAHNISMSS